MRLLVSLACALAAAVALAACNPQDSSAPAQGNSAARSSTPATGSAATPASATPQQPQQPQQQPDNVRRISMEEARAAVARGDAVFFDVRNDVQYNANHIQGAKFVPYNEVEKHLSEFPKDKLIITYCA